MKNEPQSLLDTELLQFNIEPFNEKDVEDSGYIKLPQKVFEKINMGFQYIPGIVAAKATESAANKAIKDVTKNAYKVVLKDGMHLANSHTKNGAFKGLVFDSNNNLKGQADLLPISLDGSVVSTAPQIALGVFNVLSIATGQYFLAKINGKLSNIEEGLSDVLKIISKRKKEVRLRQMI